MVIVSIRICAGVVLMFRVRISFRDRVMVILRIKQVWSYLHSNILECLAQS